jgi:hypothetical protein
VTIHLWGLASINAQSKVNPPKGLYTSPILFPHSIHPSRSLSASAVEGIWPVNPKRLTVSPPPNLPSLSVFPWNPLPFSPSFCISSPPFLPLCISPLMHATGPICQRPLFVPPHFISNSPSLLFSSSFHPLSRTEVSPLPDLPSPPPYSLRILLPSLVFSASLPSCMPRA